MIEQFLQNQIIFSLADKLDKFGIIVYSGQCLKLKFRIYS